MGGRYKRLDQCRTPALRKAAGARESDRSVINGAWNSISTPIIAPAIYLGSIEYVGERATRSARSGAPAGDCRLRTGQATEVADEWLRPTLLAAAFDLGEPDKAEELADDVIADGPPIWKVHSVLHDLEASVLQVSDVAKRERLSTVIDQIKAG